MNKPLEYFLLSGGAAPKQPFNGTPSLRLGRLRSAQPNPGGNIYPIFIGFSHFQALQAFMLLLGQNNADIT